MILHLAKMYSFGKKEFLVIEIDTLGFALDPGVAEIQKIKKKIKMVQGWRCKGKKLEWIIERNCSK